ncbi:hypothetical protein V7S43_007856 [Phytophthora oleae]|uniref:Uncharacterized protein n=1 Tax=Phytophthora oleae TaxID=2107226 RepID=A0ABD3FM12_9STRA
MEGGRGGGRGKGKKNKAAKKKAASSAKKVAANNSNVQVVAVSTALEPAAVHEPMTKSKRKRLKKAAGAANALLKAAQSNVQQVKKSPTATSPKPKVAMLAQTSTAAARPHLVSLSGKKKKKRKRTVSESEETVAVATPKEEQKSEAKKSPAIKKKIVVLSHSGVSPTAAKTRPAHLDPESKESVVKAAETALSPGKKVKKLKAKSAVKSPKDAQSVVKKDEKKKKYDVAVDSASKPTVVTASPKTTKEEVPLTRKSGQEKLGKKTPGAVAAPKKISATKNDAAKDFTSVPPATVNDKPARSGSVFNAVVSAPAALSKPAESAVAPARNVCEASSTPEQATAQGSGSTDAMCPANATAKTIPESEKHVAPTLAGKEAFTSSQLPSGSLKRRRSIGQASTSTPPDSLQPPAKRTAVLREGAVDKSIAAEERKSRDKTPDLVPQARIQHTKSRPQAVIRAEVKSTDTSTQVEREAPTAASSRKPLSSARSPPTEELGNQKPVSEVRSTTQSSGKRPLKSAPERKKSPSGTQAPTDKKLKPQVTIDTNTSSALSKIEDVALGSFGKVPSARVSNDTIAKTVMDSHAYVEKMMKSELDTKKSGGNRSPPKQPDVALPTRPQNAWGASFGMVPPATVATAPARALSTTPLSSWFLSKGCANFVKHVHFSDDEEDDCSNSGDFTGRTPTPHVISKAPPKWRASSAKKNAFLESLTDQLNWRTWYGEVDVNNLLDPPLAHVPEELRSHKVTPLALPEPVAADTLTKRTSELEILETDIKREKQRGLAFSEQLLMMLQGKTVSGKLLGDEYKALLH